MKKSLLLCAMLLVSTLAFAQTQKGQVQLGGVVNYSSRDIGAIEVTSFNFSPQVGYFLSDNTSLGITLSISGATAKSGNNENEQDLFEFGVFARFHKSVADKFYFFLQPSLSFGSGTDGLNGTSSDLNTTNIQVAPGAIYFVTPKIAMEMSVGSVFYNSVKETTNGTEVTNDNFGLNFNLTNVSLGASFYF